MRRSRPRKPFACLAAGGLAGALLLARPTPGRAQDTPLPGLIVHRTDDTLDCPDADALAARVARHMGRPALDPGSARARLPAGPALDVQIYRSEEGFTAVVQTGKSTRQLSDKGASCAGLGEALSITLAILLDELPPPPPAPPAPAPTPSPPPPAAPPASPPVAAVTAPPSPAPAPAFTGLSLGASALSTVGTLAHPVSFAGSASLTLTLGRFFAVEAGALIFPTQTVPFPYAVKRPADDTTPTSAQSVDLSLATGLLRGCVTFPLAAAGPRLGGCLGLLAGALHAQGQGFFVDKSSTDPWVAAEGAALFEHRLVWRLSLVTRAALLVPLARRALQVNDVLDPARSTAFSPSPVGAALDLGLRLSIW